jgi:misacylated tRNA(Ala) deacylase
LKTELLYLADAYVREFEATVVATDGDAVALDRTAFFPGGGGQPADEGTLNGVRVTRVSIQDGLVWHTLEGPVDTTVRGSIDWERRHLLMRTHMALHLVNAIAWRDHGARVTGADMQPGRGRVDLHLERMSQDLGQMIERRVNEYVDQDLEITTIFVARAEAGDEIFRGKGFDPTEDPIRTVQIADVDRQACSGTHVATTGEIGSIEVTKTKSKGRANKRVEIALLPS